MFIPTKQYPGMSGNSTGAVSGAANSRREDYTVNGETWFPMSPSHNPTPDLLQRAYTLAEKAWAIYDAAIETYVAGGIDQRERCWIEACAADAWIRDVYSLVYPVSVDITVEVGA